MPKLHQKQDGELYILHNLRGSLDDAGASVRRFAVSAEAAELLDRRGYGEGSSLPHDLFYELLEDKLLWPGQVSQFAPSDAEAQVRLTAAVRSYFIDIQRGDVVPEHAVEVFRLDVLSQALLIRDAVLKGQMLIEIAHQLANIQLPLGDVLEMPLKEMKKLLLCRTPSQWTQKVRAVFGPDFLLNHSDTLADAGAPAEASPHVAPSGRSPDAATSEQGHNCAGPISFDCLSPEQREWVISCCSKFPGVTVHQSMDSATGEIHFVFSGLPAHIPQRLVCLLGDSAH